jgi:bacterioferritin
MIGGGSPPPSVIGPVLVTAILHGTYQRHQGAASMGQDFLTDVQTLRERARAEMRQGPITEAYGADRERVIAVLNEVLATELVCVLRYKRHYYTAKGMNAGPVAAEFLQHATEEMAHVDLVAKRITELQGEPDFSPEGLATRSHSEYVTGTSLVEMVQEDLVAERIAIASYQEIIRWIGDGDPTTQDVIRTILAVEEEHADDLLSLLQDMESS